MIKTRIVLSVFALTLVTLLNLVLAQSSNTHSQLKLKTIPKKFAQMKKMQNESIELTIKQYNQRIQEIDSHPILTEDQKQQQIAFYQHLIYRARIKHIISDSQMEYHEDRENHLENLKHKNKLEKI